MSPEREIKEITSKDIETEFTYFSETGKTGGCMKKILWTPFLFLLCLILRGPRQAVWAVSLYWAK